MQTQKNFKIKFSGRQGDVWVEKVNPETLDLSSAQTVERKGAGLILAYGEVTGHMHEIAWSSLAEAWTTDKNEIVFTVSGEKAILTHQEHDYHTLTTGTYKSWIQQEYAPAAIQNVAD